MTEGVRRQRLLHGNNERSATRVRKGNMLIWKSLIAYPSKSQSSQPYPIAEVLCDFILPRTARTGSEEIR